MPEHHAAQPKSGVQPEITEQLVSVIRERTAQELGSALAMECLSVLADRGVITYRQMPAMAKIIGQEFDIGEITGRLVDQFADAVDLPRFAQAPDVPPGLTQADMDMLEGGRE